MRRPLGAIGRYKRELRAIQKARRDATVKPIAKAPLDVLRGTDGLWRVWSGREFLSGPYEERDEAQAWIDEKWPGLKTP